MVLLASVWAGQSQWVRFYLSWPFGRVEITDHLVVEGLEPMYLRPEDVEVIEMRWVFPTGRLFEIKHHRADLPKYLAFSVWNHSKVEKQLLQCGFMVLRLDRKKGKGFAPRDMPRWTKVLTIIAAAAGSSALLAWFGIGDIVTRANIIVGIILGLIALLRL